MRVDDLKELVPYLGIALGDRCEIALQDCSRGCIVSIANGHVSGRKVGAPLTDLAKKIIDTNEWKIRDYITGYNGYTLDGKLMRSSTFFIKEKGELLGMLCINIDTSEYSRLSELILNLGGLMAGGKPVLIGSRQNITRETFIDNIGFAISDIMKKLYGDSIPNNLTKEDRLTITRYLDDKEIFMVKGAVSRVAEKLGCSEASMYRYLALARRGKQGKEDSKLKTY